MNRFAASINGWASWAQVFQSINAFEPLIKYILKCHNVPWSEIEHCIPGTNAVFKVGGLVVKIFAPNKSGLDTDSDYKTELFGLDRANRLGISAPQLVASDKVEDKYLFPYLVMEYISGGSLGQLEGKLTDSEKRDYAKQLREITDSMNTPCERFNDIDILARALECRRWSKFPASIQHERKEYLMEYQITTQVYVHGDLTCDNILLDPSGTLYIVDFADAALAPAEYELAPLMFELFRFEKPYLDGYFGKYSPAEIAEICFDALLMHDFGADMIERQLGNIDQITNLAVLKDRLFAAIKNHRRW